MKASRVPSVAAALVILVSTAVFANGPPTRQEINTAMGLKSDGDRVRGQMDTVGFVVTDAQAEDAVSTAVQLEREAFPPLPGTLVGGVCPHDDHLYAGRVYTHLTQRLRAPRVLLIGVFHAARLWDLEDRLVFDDFDAWHGPWGPVPVDPLRSELIDALDPSDLVVDNAMQSREHSLEAIVPFLQYQNREITIVPVLVPYMGWERIDALTTDMATALSKIMAEHGWRLGRDLAIVISSDAVHYGDDFDHIPFGTDADGYRLAVSRDHELVAGHLTGPLSADRLEALLDALVADDDIRRYRIPWCGRFSVPFGLELLRKLSLATEGAAPVGTLVRYGTSLSEAELPVAASTREEGLGYTAPSNFHHWVGYAAVAVTVAPAHPPGE